MTPKAHEDCKQKWRNCRHGWNIVTAVEKREYCTIAVQQIVQYSLFSTAAENVYKWMCTMFKSCKRKMHGEAYPPSTICAFDFRGKWQHICWVLYNFLDKMALPVCNLSALWTLHNTLYEPYGMQDFVNKSTQNYFDPPTHVTYL